MNNPKRFPFWVSCISVCCPDYVPPQNGQPRRALALHQMSIPHARAQVRIKYSRHTSIRILILADARTLAHSHIANTENMTFVMLIYSFLFAWWAWIVAPQNLLLCACHVANIGAQANQVIFTSNVPHKYYYTTMCDVYLKTHIRTLFRVIMRDTAQAYTLQYSFMYVTRLVHTCKFVHTCNSACSFYTAHLLCVRVCMVFASMLRTCA